MRGAYLETLYELAKRDENVYALISDNGAIVYDTFKKSFPDRLINAGISEQNMVGMAAGMAERGKIPFAYTIGAFLSYRAYEFILNDVCLMNKNVKLVGIGAGCSYSMLGASHHTVFDLSVLRCIPNLVIMSPASPLEVRKVTMEAYNHIGPVYIRLGTNREAEIYEADYNFIIGKAVTLRNGNDITVIGTGSILRDIIDVADEIKDLTVRVINMHTIKPFDYESVCNAIEETKGIITVEDHQIVGGLGSSVAEVIADYGKGIPFKRIGLEGFSKGYGSYKDVKDKNGIGKKQIKETIVAMAKQVYC